MNNYRKRLQNISSTNDSSGRCDANMLDPQAGSLKTEWLTSNEAANYLRISIGTLRNMTSNGQLPYSKLGRRNRYDTEKLKELLLQNQRGKNGN